MTPEQLQIIATLEDTIKTHTTIIQLEQMSIDYLKRQIEAIKNTKTLN